MGTGIERRFKIGPGGLLVSRDRGTVWDENIFFEEGFTSRWLFDTCPLMDRWWPSERRIKRYERLGDCSIEPYGQKFYVHWQGRVYNVGILWPCLVVLTELGEKGEC